MNTNIKTISTLQDVFFIKDFSLLKIMVLKEKFLDQLQQVSNKDTAWISEHSERFVIVGRAKHSIVIEVDGQLYLQHVTDHTEWLANRTADGSFDAQRKASRIIYDTYPQLFIE